MDGWTYIHSLHRETYTHVHVTLDNVIIHTQTHNFILSLSFPRFLPLSTHIPKYHDIPFKANHTNHRRPHSRNRRQSQPVPRKETDERSISCEDFPISFFLSSAASSVGSAPLTRVLRGCFLCALGLLGSKGCLANVISWRETNANVGGLSVSLGDTLPTLRLPFGFQYFFFLYGFCIWINNLLSYLE